MKKPLNVQTRHWPILYKKSSSGKILQWQIWTEGATIHTEHGYVGLKLTTTADTVKSGKNIGRANETTCEVQAELEAASKYKKYLDKGFAPKDSEPITSDVTFPMLAHEFTKHAKKVTYPVYVQPKLDGIRMVASYGKTFMSRRGKPLAVPKRVQDAIKKYFPDVIVDGELYNHEYRSDFSKIVSATRTMKGEAENLDLIQYHIYDIIMDAPYYQRRKIIQEALSTYKGNELVRVKSYPSEDLEDITRRYQKLLEYGYEGAMIRLPNSPYEIDKRSYGLLKYKPVYDGEYRIIGVEEGRGRLSGHVGAFVCAIKDQYGERTFNTTLTGSGITSFLKEAWEDHSLWKGKLMRVEHLGLTDTGKVPRHPRGVEILDKDRR